MNNTLKDDKIFTARISRHVLFNGLNSAIVLCRREPQEASELINSLSQCLIYTSEHQAEGLVPLSYELSFIKSYLHIQSVRFGRRLKINFDLQETMGFLPAFTLQPLVDNVFHHVMLYTREEVMLTVKTTRDTEGTIVTVQDNRVGMEPSQLENFWQKYRGRSLDILNAALVKNDLPELAIDSVKGKGTSVSIRAKYL